MGKGEEKNYMHKTRQTNGGKTFHRKCVMTKNNKMHLKQHITQLYEEKKIIMTNFKKQLCFNEDYIKTKLEITKNFLLLFYKYVYLLIYFYVEKQKN